jgi:hypothetical protein
MSNETVDQAHARLGHTAPRISPADLEANIVGEWYFTAAEGAHGHNQVVSYPAAHPLSLLTFCVLVLRNGYTVVGHAGVVSPQNFNAEIGRRVAREDAVRQLWPLMGYQLRHELWLAEQRAAWPVDPAPPPFGGAVGVGINSDLVVGDANLGAHEQQRASDDGMPAAPGT